MNLSRKARSATGLTQEQFAQALGVSRPSVAAWENGYREPQGAARTLLLLVQSHPKLVLRVSKAWRNGDQRLGQTA